MYLLAFPSTIFKLKSFSAASIWRPTQASYEPNFFGGLAIPSCTLERNRWLGFVSFRSFGFGLGFGFGIGRWLSQRLQPVFLSELQRTKKNRLGKERARWRNRCAVVGSNHVCPIYFKVVSIFLIIPSSFNSKEFKVLNMRLRRVQSWKHLSIPEKLFVPPRQGRREFM